MRCVSLDNQSIHLASRTSEPTISANRKSMPSDGDGGGQKERSCLLVWLMQRGIPRGLLKEIFSRPRRPPHPHKQAMALLCSVPVQGRGRREGLLVKVLTIERVAAVAAGQKSQPPERQKGRGQFLLFFPLQWKATNRSEINLK